VSKTTALLCRGDARRPGCGAVVGMLDRGAVLCAGGGELLAVDRLGRARLLCPCGVVTVTDERKGAMA
jgi:hypothetical protein